MMPDRLWAKSWDTDRDGTPPSHVYLAGHLDDVWHAGVRVLDSTGDDQLHAVGLAPEDWRDRFRRIVLLATAVHDLGKANDHFQGMIARTRDVRENPQGLRHEWVTLLILEQLREWLISAVDGSHDAFSIVEWAVVGHHPAHSHESPPKVNPPGSGAEITLLMDHDDFGIALRGLQSRFNLQVPPICLRVARNLVGSDNVFTQIAGWFRDSQRLWDRLRNRDDRLLVAAVKNALVASDVAGSALPRAMPEDERRWDWITESFATKPEPGDLQAIVDYRLKGDTPRAFQRLVAESAAPVTFVKAGCGSGKTLAAYMWAARNHPTKRIYFCYPTTGTATEGFKDYLYPPEAEPEQDDPNAERIRSIGAKLFHSRRDIDFELVLSTGQDIPRERVDAAMRLESLEAWSTPVVACTVDTVLGLIQNNKRGLFAWPALSQSAFVFDEIHAFDDRLFGALLRFLQDVPHLPVLLMTASLPMAREEALRSLLESQEREWKPIAGLKEFEERPRYRIEIAAGNDPLPTVRRTLAENGKVLWVCNTVGRVMEAAERSDDLGPLLYHSRFKYEDRVQRHKATIAAFDSPQNPGRALAICSQVAEMSLDLSADLLVTDLATVPALIQRLGRLNRRAEEGDPTKPFVVIEPENHRPYTPADLEAARAWLARVPGDKISQRHLANAWEQTSDDPRDSVCSAWLDGGPRTTVTELRKASPGITVLMEEDVARVRSKPKDLPRLTIPMPEHRKLNWHEWSRERGLPVAPAGTIIYKPLRGAQWRK